MKKEVGKLVKHSGIYGLGTILNKSVGFFLIPLYTHYLRPRDYGVLELLDLTLFFAGIFAMMGISSAFFRFFVAANSEDEKNDVATTALFSVVGISLLVLVVMQLLAGKLSLVTFGETSYVPLIRVVAYTLFFSNLTEVPLAYFRARQQTVLFIAIGLIRTILSASLLILAVAVLQKGVLGVVYANLASNAAVGLALVGVLIYQARGRISRSKFEEMFRYGAPLIVQSLASFVLVFSDRFFLRHFGRLSEVGVYSLGYKLASAVSLVVTGPFAMAWAWQQFELAKQENARQVFARVQTYQFYVSIFVGLCISMTAKQLLELMTPASYWGAAQFVPIIAMSYILGNLRSVLHTGILVQKRTHQIAWISIGSAIVNIGLNWWLIPPYHAMGAAVATLLSYACALGLSFWVAQRIYPVRYEYGRDLAILGMAVVTYGLGELLGFRLIQSILTDCGLLVIFLGVSVKLLSDEEMKMLRQLTRRALIRVPWLATLTGPAIIEGWNSSESESPSMNESGWNSQTVARNSETNLESAGSRNLQSMPLWTALVPIVEDCRIHLAVTRQKEAMFREVISRSWPKCSLVIHSPTMPVGNEAGPSELAKNALGTPHDCTIIEAGARLQYDSPEGRHIDLIRGVRDSIQGQAIFFVPSGFRYLIRRIKNVRSITKQQFRRLDWYVCHPGAENPSKIVKLSNDLQWAIDQISPPVIGKKGDSHASWRSIFKRTALRVLGVHDPFYSFLAVASNSPLTEESYTPSLVDKVVKIVQSSICSRPAFNITLFEQRYKGTELVFVYDSPTPVMLAVATLCQKDSPVFEAFERKRDNLFLATSALTAMTGPRITSPKILHSEQNKYKALFVTSAAKGSPVFDYVKEYSRTGNLRGLRVLMQESMDFAVQFHSVLEERLRGRIPPFGQCYRENYLGIQGVSNGSGFDAGVETARIQHGDLSAENVFFDRTNASWSVIDWEWLGSGYPPLFDVFTYLRSVGAAYELTTEGDWRNQFLKSSIQVFFGRSPISSLYRDLLESYCELLKVEPAKVFDYFKQFVLWRCNRYRLDGGADPEAKTVWEELLTYTASHGPEFIFLRG